MYGGIGVDPAKPRINVFHDVENECLKYEEKFPNRDLRLNPWVQNYDQIKFIYEKREKYKLGKLREKFATGFLTKEEYDENTVFVKEQIKLELDGFKNFKKKFPCRINYLEKISKQEDGKNTNVRDIYINPNKNSSITVLASTDPKNIDIKQRYISTQILQDAKVDINRMMLKIIKLFHEDTRPDVVKEFFKKDGFEEAYVYLGGTDTDSCKLQIIAVAKKDCDLGHDFFAEEIRRLIGTFQQVDNPGHFFRHMYRVRATINSGAGNFEDPDHVIKRLKKF